MICCGRSHDLECRSHGAKDESYNAVKRKYTSIFMGILEYMQVYVDIHKFVKVYKVDIPGYIKIYSV